MGNKTSILYILYALFPLNYEKYIEPFGGSGAVLLGKKKPDKFEVYNDYNHNLVNLFRCMRDRPMAFIKELGFYPLNSRDDFNAIRDFFRQEKFEDKYFDEELELTKIILPDLKAEEIIELYVRMKQDYDLRRAVMFLKLLRYSYSSGGKSFACQPFSVVSLFQLIEQVGKRLENTVIENQDFEVLIKHYDRDNAFFYCDPPYFSSEYVYQCGFTWDDHLRLKNTLANSKGKWLVSYNDCSEIRELYDGYGIYNNGKLVDKYTTDKNGSFTTSYYVCGDKWTLKEIEPSEGYILDETEYHIGAEAKKYTLENNSISIGVTEDILKGKIAIIKHTDDGSTKIETPEKGAEFQVYLKSAGSYSKAKDTERDILTCDEYGFAETKNLPYGTYTVHQSKGWNGTEFIADFDVFVSKNNKTYKYLINNASLESYVKIVKIDSETGKQIPYAGAGFQIYDSNGKPVTMTYTYPEVTTIDTFYTNSDGYLITPEPLPYGKGYSAVEVQAPYGYVLDSTPIYFDITAENTSEENGVTIVKAEKKNTPQKGTIIVEKTGEIFSNVTAIGGGYTDENGNDVALPTIYQPEYSVSGLAGAVFEIYADEDITTPDGTIRYTKDTLVDTITTGEKGTATSKQLYLGKYRFVEKTAPYGFVLNRTVNHIELTYAGQNEKVTNTSTSFTNDRQKAEIDLTKILEQDEKFYIGNNDEIRNVSFGLYADEDLKASNGTVIPKDGLVEIIACDEKGKAQFTTDIPIGSYYVKEISTDIHYILSDKKYPVVFEYAGQDTATVHISVNDGEPIINDIIYGTIKGLKIDRETGENIAGALFGLFSITETEFTEETAIMTAESNEGGIFEFTYVPYGEYIVRELKPAEGYLPNEENYQATVSEDEEVIEITVENDKIPELGTTATIDGKKEVGATEVFTLEDVVEYKHLVPGKEYTFKGILMDKATGKELLIDGKKITSEVTFTPEEPTGEVIVFFEFDARYIKENTDIVVFESLYSEDKELAVHADIDDEGQTVTVKIPKIGTKASIDGKKEFTANGNITIDDVVSYKNLTAGKEYTISGVLMDKATGKALLVDGEEIRSEVTFTPETADGEVTVSFTFDGSVINKDTEIVVFETLYREGAEIAVHADIDDKNQTVTIHPQPEPEKPQTGDNSNLGFYIGLGSVAVGGLIAFIIIKLKKKDEDDE